MATVPNTTELPYEKECRRCLATKLSRAFHRDPRNADGLQAWCKGCMAWNSKRHYDRNRQKMVDRARAWTIKNPERTLQNRQRRRFARYGLTEAQYLAILKRQGGGCAICSELNDEMAIDPTQWRKHTTPSEGR